MGQPARIISSMEARITSLMGDPADPLLGVSLSVTDRHRTLYAKSFGQRRLEDNQMEQLDVEPSSLFRIGGLSSVFTSLITFMSEEFRLIDIHEDISRYLKWSLRNPKFPDSPVTIYHLLCHNSGLTAPNEGPVSELQTGEQIKKHVLHPEAWTHSEPGHQYCYFPAGYALVVEALEKASGRRFDIHANQTLLWALASEAELELPSCEVAYNLQDLSLPAVSQIVTRYASSPGTGTGTKSVWGPVSDTTPVQFTPDKKLKSYIPGEDGLRFSPYSGLYAPMAAVSAILRMLLNEGLLGGTRFLRAQTVERILQQIEPHDSSAPSKSSEDISLRYFGPVLNGYMCDECGELSQTHGCWGYFSEEPGFRGGMLLDRVRGLGISYLVNSSSPGTLTGPEISIAANTIRTLLMHSFWSPCSNY